MKKARYLSLILIISIVVCGLSPRLTSCEEKWPDAPGVAAQSAIVMDVDSGAILYEKNSHERLYPASITKVMTTLLALENRSLSEMVHFSRDSVYKVEGTQVGITPDEDVPLEECLYGVMLASGNEIAYAVAEHVGGSFENFVNMMNERATQLGCTDTHFNNPHGLPDENHYTSAYDMALISQAAYRLDDFRKIAGTTYHIIPPTNLYGEERAMSNHHGMLINSSFHYDYCTGGKTGYTNAARYNLVTFAEKNGMRLVCVVMRDEERTMQYNDSTALLNYCFDNFHHVSVADVNQGSSLHNDGLFPLNENVFSGSDATISYDENASITLPNDLDVSEITHEVSYREPADEDVAADLIYKYGERLLGKIPLSCTVKEVSTAHADQPVSEKQGKFVAVNVKIIAYVILAVLVAIILILLILNFLAGHHFSSPMDLQRNKQRRRRRRNRRRRRRNQQRRRY